MCSDDWEKDYIDRLTADRLHKATVSPQRHSQEGVDSHTSPLLTNVSSLVY